MSFSLRVLNGLIRSREENAVTLPHSAQRKHEFLGKIKDMSKKNKSPARNKIVLEWLNKRLGHISTRSLLAGDTENVWEDVELIIYPDPFCTSCQISSMKKRLDLRFHSSQRHPSSGFLWI